MLLALITPECIKRDGVCGDIPLAFVFTFKLDSVSDDSDSNSFSGKKEDLIEGDDTTMVSISDNICSAMLTGFRSDEDGDDDIFDCCLMCICDCDCDCT